MEALQSELKRRGMINIKTIMKIEKAAPKVTIRNHGTVLFLPALTEIVTKKDHVEL